MKRTFWAFAVSAVLLAYHLAPFDFVITTEQLHSTFRRIQLFEVHVEWNRIAQELGAACWFALLAFLMTSDERRRGGLQIPSIMAGFLHGLILACLIECLQLFTHSHRPEVFAAVVRATGALLGSYTAASSSDVPWLIRPANSVAR